MQLYTTNKKNISLTFIFEIWKVPKALTKLSCQTLVEIKILVASKYLKPCKYKLNYNNNNKIS